MYAFETKIRVRYNETDKMGIVYHANYIAYYEIARTELLRSTGAYSYNEMETGGVIMPVVEVQSRYLRSAYYDETLTVRVIIEDLPTARITFLYEIFNEKQELLNTGKTVLGFVNSETHRACRPPEKLIKCLSELLKIAK
jgi:acyl-CoA thioester hydrolase